MATIILRVSEDAASDVEDWLEWGDGVWIVSTIYESIRRRIRPENITIQHELGEGDAAQTDEKIGSLWEESKSP